MVRINLIHDSNSPRDSESMALASAVDMNAAVGDAMKMLRRLIGENIFVSTIFAPALKPIRIDPGELQQVILNLAVNACDAMPRGGQLTLRTDHLLLDADGTQGGCGLAPGNYVVLTVSDTREGMSADSKKQLFEPYFATKGPHTKTGPGLAAAHRIVRACGGHIHVQSRFGRGSTFTVYFPAACEAVPDDLVKHLPATPHGNATVLVVEDEESVRSLVRQVLLACGYRVLEAADGVEALQLAEQCPEPIHLLVADVVMPNLGGRALADRLVALRPQIRVLLLSGYTHDAVAQHGVINTEYAFLQKPFTMTALTQMVRDVLNHSTFRSGA